MMKMTEINFEIRKIPSKGGHLMKSSEQTNKQVYHSLCTKCNAHSATTSRTKMQKYAGTLSTLRQD